jgi:hypothetical protein
VEKVVQDFSEFAMGLGFLEFAVQPTEMLAPAAEEEGQFAREVRQVPSKPKANVMQKSLCYWK